MITFTNVTKRYGRRAALSGVSLTLRPGAITLLLGLSKGNAWGWTSGRVLGLLATSSALTLLATSAYTIALKPAITSIARW